MGTRTGNAGDGIFRGAGRPAPPAGGAKMEAEDVPAEPEGAAPAEEATREAQAAKADEYLQTLQRLKADFDNYRRRTAADQARLGESAVAAFILQLLPVVDNLERAFAAAGDVQAVRQGVDLTVRQLREVLQAVGVRPMECRGVPFDPVRHEAVSRGPAPGVADGLVAEEYRRGYLFREQVLRPAMVRVAQGDGAAAEPAAAETETPAGKEGEPS